MLYAIIFVTCAISFYGFSNPEMINKLALWPYRVVRCNEWQRLITHMFVHSGWGHLAINMLVLYSFSSALSFYLGGAAGGATLQLFFLYFGGGIASALVSTAQRKNDPYYLSIGASAGVSSLIFASICFQPWAPIYFFGMLPIPGILLGAGYLFYSYYKGRQQGQRVDHMAHFYGAVFGLLYPMLTMRGAFVHFINSLVNVPWF